MSADVITVELRKEVLQRHMANLPEVLSSALATPRYATAGSGPPAIPVLFTESNSQGSPVFAYQVPSASTSATYSNLGSGTALTVR